MTANEKMVDELAKMFAKYDKMPVEKGIALIKIMDRAPKEALQMIVDRKVKFCWMLAANRLESMNF